MANNSNTRTAFVTGITGQTGSYLAELLLEKGYYVVGIKRRTSVISTDRIDHLLNNPMFKLEYGNIIDGSCLYRLLNKYKPIEVYNLAAMSHVRVSFEVPEETLEVVAMGTLKLLNACKEVVPLTRFYQASSSEQFGDNPVVPQTEETRMIPASPYACAKLCAHNLARNYRTGYGMHVSCGLLFNHESPRRGETFVTKKIAMAAARIKLGLQNKLLLGNLEAKRDWGYAPDYAKAIWLMTQQETPDDYVIATGETHTVREFLEEVFVHAGLDIAKHVETDSRLFRPNEVPVLLGDATKAKTKLGWEPTVKFKQLAKLMFFSELLQLQQQ